MKEKNTTLPNLTHILVILLLGFVSYGLSIFAYVRAQNRLGAAKTSAYYSIAPFIGVVLSAFILKETISGMFCVALIFMIFGSGLVAYDTRINA